MTDILKDKIPIKIKVELWLDIDRDVWLEKIANGYEINAYLNDMIKHVSMSPHLFRDHDRPVITAIKYEDN